MTRPVGAPGTQDGRDSAQRLIRWSTVAAVAAVALIAGWVSYQHAYRVVSSHGESGIIGRMHPGTIDGLIYAASMAMLDAARRGAPPPRLARWLLAAGIGSTLLTNVLAGAASGVLGAAVAAWPALALVGSYELLMLIIRGAVPATAATASRARASTAPPTSTGLAGAGPASTRQAGTAATVRAAYRASVAAGSPLSQRAMARQFGISRRTAARLAAEAAGPPDVGLPFAA